MSRILFERGWTQHNVHIITSCRCQVDKHGGKEAKLCTSSWDGCLLGGAFDRQYTICIVTTPEQLLGNGRHYRLQPQCGTSENSQGRRGSYNYFYKYEKPCGRSQMMAIRFIVNINLYQSEFNRFYQVIAKRSGGAFEGIRPLARG